ncbi:hypothetical protein DESAMIL20_311 [Desulfurella amilsii]|jgi:type IV conjugative transfer system protein TraL|uniref:Type IV conjugative transfer system protein TraL n=1 Tax=Desulfurella amilsii TaxID=1562698 RepID=A0A1X4XZB5_9BACT|nr:type IV conjugative transfer system protein TraL [Desulfurella amilsii]OSS42881.1 hypothetical protein DESAMIL20_311 [Desulfurella amilsii]
MRNVPKIIDEPLKVFIFDKEDGIVGAGIIGLLIFFVNNLLLLLIITLLGMVAVNRYKNNKPKGIIFQTLYKNLNITFGMPIKYLGNKAVLVK